MALPEVGDGRVVGLLEHLAGRRRGQHRRQRRVVDRIGAGIVGPGGDQQGAAVAHIAGDVVEIEQRQHAAMLVAVEDDQVELVDLLREQLAGGEGDQRQLVDRRAVLLLRRAQDGEVDEVDRGVRLQQVAPGALAGMRLAGDQQHAQVLADALDGDDGAVVDRRQLAGERLRLELDDVGPAMGDVDDELAGHAGQHLLRRQRLAVDVDRHGDRRVVAGDAVVDDAELDHLALVDDAEARRAVDDDAPVGLAGVAGEENVQRRVRRQARLARRDVVDLAVGEHDDGADAVGRHVGKRGRERTEQIGAVDRLAAGGAAGVDAADLDVVEGGEPLGQLVGGLRPSSCRGRRGSGWRCGRPPWRRRSTAARAAR